MVVVPVCWGVVECPSRVTCCSVPRFSRMKDAGARASATMTTMMMIMCLGLSSRGWFEERNRLVAWWWVVVCCESFFECRRGWYSSEEEEDHCHSSGGNCAYSVVPNVLVPSPGDVMVRSVYRGSSSSWPWSQWAWSEDCPSKRRIQ